MGAAFLTASAGLVASSGQEPGAVQQPAGKADGGQPSPDDQVEALVREYEGANAARRRDFGEILKDRAKLRASSEEFSKLRKDFAKRFLALAERYPRTNAAEQALTWLVCNDRSFERGPEAERAREILARDHVRSDRIKAVLAETSSVVSWGSPITENLLRRVLERSPYYEIRGLACYRLAELLIERSERVRIWQLLGRPPQSDDRLIRSGPEQVALMGKSDPSRLDDEAALLLERMIAEFPRVIENHNGKNELGIQLQGPAKTELDRLRRLSAGKQAPEIDGIDLDERPMKLSAYRGKVVVLYFSPMYSIPPGTRTPMLVIQSLRGIAAAVSGKPAVILGATTWHRDEFRTAIRDNSLPVRFWWDQAKADNLVGPIHTAWDAYDRGFGATCYVIDPRGTIRYKLPANSELIGRAVNKILEKQ